MGVCRLHPTCKMCRMGHSFAEWVQWVCVSPASRSTEEYALSLLGERTAGQECERARGWRERDREREAPRHARKPRGCIEWGGMQPRRADSQMCAPHEQSELSRQAFQNSAASEHANPHSVITQPAHWFEFIELCPGGQLDYYGKIYQANLYFSKSQILLLFWSLIKQINTPSNPNLRDFIIPQSLKKKLNLATILKKNLH
jgi:hypothetical protein